MNRPLLRLLGLVGFGAVMAQAGHLIVYQLEYGTAAQAVQSRGAHAYFPILVKTGFGLMAAVALSALLVIGLARVLPGRPVVVTSRGPSYLNVVAALFTIQLTVFVGQETIESFIAGDPLPSALQLLLFGAIGQLPVAALAALALKWLAVRFRSALLTLDARLSILDLVPHAIAVPFPRLAAAPAPALIETCPAVYIKRGPPPILRA